MLTIPDSIKTLYKTDVRPDVRKNFRVTFPNGELPDITNDQIVRESVKWTESIMSQQNFRFGLAEAPQISFETVGVGNMMGMTIRCWSEIETTTLTAAEIAEIEEGDYDGTLVDEEDSDIGFGFYRIPLGEFIVQSCPRSHGAMTHRQVQATGRTLSNTSMDAFTQWKLAQFFGIDTWSIDWNFFAPSVYGSSWAQASKYYDAATYSPVTGTVAGGVVFRIYLGSDEYHFQNSTSADIKWVVKSAYRPLYYDGVTILRIDRTGLSAEAVTSAAKKYAESIVNTVEELYPAFTDWSTAYTRSGTTQSYFANRSAVIDYLAEPLLANVPAPYIWRETGDKFLLDQYRDIDLILSTSVPGTNPLGYTVRNLVCGISDAKITFTVPGQIPSSSAPLPALDIDGVNTTFYSLTLKSAYSVDVPNVALSSTLEKPVSGIKTYSFYNSFSFPKILTSIFELNGIFGKRMRSGAIEPYTLTTTSQENLTQSDIDELWWDEATVNPIGKVSVKYIDEGKNEQDAIITIGDGSSVYNMEDNYILTKFPTDLDSVTAFIQGKFATNAAALTWTSTDATVRGLPYLEAGDWVTADTGATDVTEVGFPLLQRDMSGIQFLKDDIVSNAGDIVEVTYQSGEEETDA